MKRAIDMQISAAMVKELRERTGAAMMECKKALVATGGDMEAAVEHMRKAGLAQADKKSGRVAAEGVVVIEVAADASVAAMVEVNSETDFVSKGNEFNDFAKTVAQRVLTDNPTNLEALMEAPLSAQDNRSIETARQELVAKIGENLQVRRFARHEATEGKIGRYLHGGRIGVLVVIRGADDALAKDIAMHVAASRPICIAEEQVAPETLDKERQILIAQAEESGKPPDIIAKMVEGRLKKYLAEVTLLGQPFVKDPDQTVGKLLKSANAEAVYFERFEVGEGIEKRDENFADEVMAQVQSS
jgi:elongation factor Ts